MDKIETVYASARDHGDSLIAEQKRLDAERDAMADEIIAGQHVTSVEEGLRFARGWITTAAQYAANADYFQSERDKAALALDTQCVHVQTLLAALRDAVRLGGELRRRAIMADVLDEHEDPFEAAREVLDAALTGQYPPTRAELEVATLRNVILTANGQLFDSSVDDVEHQLDSHADTLPEAFRRVAAGHAAAFETLQEVVREWVAPSPPTVRGADTLSNDLANEDGQVLCDQCMQRVNERPDRSGIVAHRCPHGVECILEPGDPRMGKLDWVCKDCMSGDVFVRRVKRVPRG